MILGPQLVNEGSRTLLFLSYLLSFVHETPKQVTKGQGQLRVGALRKLGNHTRFSHTAKSRGRPLFLCLHSKLGCNTEPVQKLDRLRFTNPFSADENLYVDPDITDFFANGSLPWRLAPLRGGGDSRSRVRVMVWSPEFRYLNLGF